MRAMMQREERLEREREARLEMQRARLRVEAADEGDPRHADLIEDAMVKEALANSLAVSPAVATSDDTKDDPWTVEKPSKPQRPKKKRKKKDEWECPDCRTRNFPTRRKCRKCDSFRPGLDEDDAKRERKWQETKAKAEADKLESTLRFGGVNRQPPKTGTNRLTGPSLP